eukprot:12214738-Alexandrium_andersonii.AAC.2
MTWRGLASCGAMSWRAACLGSCPPWPLASKTADGGGAQEGPARQAGSPACAKLPSPDSDCKQK